VINHARTLLLNRPGGKQVLTELGEEYIPVKFVPQTLPNWLELYWKVLFGTKPDNAYKNYQVDRMLRMVHATDYGAYLFEHDKRITYDPTADNDFTSAEYGLSINDAPAVGASANYVVGVDRVGELVANEVVGHMSTTWDIVFTDASNHATVTNRQTGDTLVTLSAVTPGVALSNNIALPGTSMNIKLTFSWAGSPTYPHGAAIVQLAKPATDLTTLFDTVGSVGDSAHTLFNSMTAEPYQTFYNLWRQTKSFPDRVAGFVLAMVYQLNTLYVSAGTRQ